MKAFLSRFRSLVLFVLSGFDRLRFRGESRLLNHALGVQSYLARKRAATPGNESTGNVIAASRDLLSGWPRALRRGFVAGVLIGG